MSEHNISFFQDKPDKAQENVCIDLKHQCRKVIRNHMMKVSKVNLFVRVPQLQLPSIMTKYLLYDAEPEFVEELIARQIEDDQSA